MMLAGLLALQLAASPTPAIAADRGLTGAYDARNPFARILRGELPREAVVYEDAHVLAFVPLRMQTPGHVLVISKTSRARNLLDIEAVELDRVMAVVQRVARAQRDVLDAEGVQLRQNSGEAAGQTVFHAHFHVIPRWKGGELRSGEGPSDPLAERQAMADRLAAALR